MQVFRDITVMPTQILLGSDGTGGKGQRGIVFRGGPVWPGFARRIAARHCRGLLPIPHDRRPLADDAPRGFAAAGIWCGPVCAHYGHMIADFGSRIAEAVERSDGVPLVFSLGPDVDAEPPPFFQAMLRHYGVAEERVILVREPTRFGTLHVAAQAERHDGPGPSPAHLDRMDRIVARHGSVAQEIGCLFVSRARYPDGRLAAEAYLEQALVGAGAVAIHPESLDLKTQLAFYRRARTIVFTEGSAVHSLQLLGRLDARAIVLVRRAGTRLARRMLRPRLRALDHWDLTAGMVYGRMPGGQPQRNRALSLIDDARLLARFGTIGIDLAPHWDRAAYRAARDADLAQWIAYMRHWNLHPDARATIARCLKAAGIDLPLDAIWDGRSAPQQAADLAA